MREEYETVNKIIESRENTEEENKMIKDFLSKNKPTNLDEQDIKEDKYKYMKNSRYKF